MQVKDLQMTRALRTALLVLLLNVVGMAKGQYLDYFGSDGLYYGILEDNPTCVALVSTDCAEYGFVNLVLTNPVIYEYYNGYGIQHDEYTLVSIGGHAFQNCTSLASIEIPNSVTTIGEFAFSGCSGLTSIEIPNSVTSIGAGAFDSCTSLATIEIPNSVTIIESSTFEYCTSLASIEIPNSVTTIGESAFSNCTSLASVEFEAPSSLITIGMEAFYLCSNLSSIEIPESVTSIKNGTFMGCGNLGSIKIPSSVTTIEPLAFYGTLGLTSIEFEAPSSLTIIGNSAFHIDGMDCSILDTIEIPNSVTSIGLHAFSRRNLKHIMVASNNPVFDSRGDCNAIIKTSENELIAGSENTIIPHTVTSIGEYAFEESTIDSILIPNSVITLGRGAFENCYRLVSVEFEKSSLLTVIKNRAFINCLFLNSIEIPNSVDSIGDMAFFQNSRLKSVVLGNSVTYIGRSTFAQCRKLASVVMQATNPPELANNVFSGDNNFYNNNYTIYEDSFTIYVPYESLNAYKTAEYWNNYEPYIKPMFTPSVVGYASSTSNDKWTFIALPLADEIDPAMVFNLLSEDSGYDLYQFDQSAAGEEWRNYKVDSFNLVNGRGYLYARAVDVNLVIGGDFNEDETKEVSLNYDARKPFAGWNLVGNPFPVGAYINRSYYVMNATGSGIEPMAISSSIPVPVCAGVMVKAETAGESVVFNRTAPSNKIDLGKLQIELTESIPNRDGVSTGSTTAVDKAIVSFNAGDRLEKYVFNKDNARISIPQGGKDLAIACADKQGEMSLDFKATKNGTYTLNVDVENADVDYLHLIDNLTGADVDLLVSPEYTFEAKTSDYASRFCLVFSVCGDADGDNAPFAFISNGNIIIIGAEAGAVLQIVDVLGHVIVSSDVARNVSTNEMTPGVYVLRLINGNDVKTQKIVID